MAVRDVRMSLAILMSKTLWGRTAPFIVSCSGRLRGGWEPLFRNEVLEMLKIAKAWN